MARKKLQSYIKSVPDTDMKAVNPLPLIHVTKLGIFHHKINGNKLEPAEVKVGEYKKKVICFFYGRAAYIPDKGKKNNISLCQWHPVCIAISPENISISGVYPFDTGAYTKDIGAKGKNVGFRRHYFPTFEKDELCLFSLSKSLSSVQNYIHTIFGSNKSYIERKAKTLDDFTGVSPLDDDTLDCLLKMINDNEFPLGKIDGRVECIEIQSEESIQIKPGDENVLFICCPIHQMDLYMGHYTVIPYEYLLDRGTPKKNFSETFVKNANKAIKERWLIPRNLIDNI